MFYSHKNSAVDPSPSFVEQSSIDTFSLCVISLLNHISYVAEFATIITTCSSIFIVYFAKRMAKAEWECWLLSKRVFMSDVLFVVRGTKTTHHSSRRSIDPLSKYFGQFAALPLLSHRPPSIPHRPPISDRFRNQNISSFVIKYLWAISESFSL
jgi:hypothetical protein